MTTYICNSVIHNTINKRYYSKKIIFSTVCTIIMLLAMSQARAGYIFGLDQPANFSIFNTPTKWEPGANNARINGFPALGGATWSIMGAGLTEIPSIIDAFNHTGLSQDITTLGFSSSNFESMINSMLDIWADVSGFSNLGQVTDSGSNVAAPNSTGDIRIAAWDIANPNALAHAFQPGTEAIFGAIGSIGGDLHFDTGRNFVDDAAADSSIFDIFTVALHELGHALGLGHSDVQGSVMEPIYVGSRRSLTTDDITGITTIYGPAPLVIDVPEPPTMLIFLFSLMVLTRNRRLRSFI